MAAPARTQFKPAREPDHLVLMPVAAYAFTRLALRGCEGAEANATPQSWRHIRAARIALEDASVPLGFCFQKDRAQRIQAAAKTVRVVMPGTVTPLDRTWLFTLHAMSTTRKAQDTGANQKRLSKRAEPLLLSAHEELKLAIPKSDRDRLTALIGNNGMTFPRQRELVSALLDI